MSSHRNSARGDFGLQRSQRLTLRDALGALILGITVAAVLSFALTVWVARELAYRDILGEPWWVFDSVPYYPAWAWIRWRQEVLLHAPTSQLATVLADAPSALGALGLVAVGCALAARARKRRDRISELHGSGHLAAPTEVDASGFLKNPRGVFLAQWLDPRSNRLRYLRHVGATHVLVSGPPRTGKDIGNFLPSALDPHDDESAVFVDPKGDAWRTTSGYRAQRGHRVLRFAPTEPPDLSAAFNPLGSIRLGTHREVADAQLLAASWLNGDGLGFEGNNALFAKASRPLFTACFLHVLYREALRGNPPANMSHVLGEFMPPDRSADEAIQDWLTFEHDPNYARGWRLPDGQPTATHPAVAAAARSYLTTDDKKLRQNILFCIKSGLELLLDDCLRTNLSRADFGLEDLVNGERPTSLYIVFPQAAAQRLAPIMRMLLEQLFDRLTEKMATRNGEVSRPHAFKLDMHLNEFTLLGRMDTVRLALPVCPSFGIRVTLYVQDPVMLREVYGPHESLSAQCATKVFYPPNHFETAKELSELIGKTTATRTTPQSVARGSTDTEHESARPVLDADEVMRIPGPTKRIDDRGEERITRAGNVLVFSRNCAPIYAQQLLYWEDDTLRKRAAVPTAAARSAASAQESEAVPERREPGAQVEALAVPVTSEDAPSPPSDFLLEARDELAQSSSPQDELARIEDEMAALAHYEGDEANC